MRKISHLVLDSMQTKRRETFRADHVIATDSHLALVSGLQTRADIITRDVTADVLLWCKKK